MALDKGVERPNNRSFPIYLLNDTGNAGFLQNNDSIWI